MALRLLTRQESGERLRWLRKQTDLNGRVLANRMGSTDPGLVSRLEKGIQLSHEWIVKASMALAGEGQLIADEAALLAFMIGATHDERAMLVPRFSVAEGDAAALAGSSTQTS